ncbi:D-alanyl-D-alanine carboxypeptidase family protein [Vogesella fluminis]|uniref:Peptidase n=1 Tax=Vogesella fluminis TaxID=1069161 RepID=A0ABQ3HB93_9NEIS|nr:M15 family metallopeptidase [Vogesella fluminis]GHD74117.1 peptidase [Vogesella fluminis]
MPHDLAALNATLGIDVQTLAARGLTPFAEADTLVVAERDASGREFELTPAAAGAWQAMHDAAAADGVTLQLVSAFRSIARQREIVATKLAHGQSLDAILRVSAAPGFSEHHTGRAVDIGTPGSPVLEEVFEQTPAFAWLQANAARFGFMLSFPRDNTCGYLYEPWHWCYRQVTA